MRLSDAIILGCTISSQGTISLKREDGSTCALGAALEAIGKTEEAIRGDYCSLEQEWPFLGARAIHPVTKERQRVNDIIMLLNDADHWSRERIAEWVRSIEPPEDEPDGGLAAGAAFEEEKQYMEVGA